MSSIKSVEDVWEFLDRIPAFQHSGASAANFSLDSIRNFCAEIGNPQEDYPGIHVAGTNGKGSTCYLLERIYRENGYKTGMFTSPHLMHYTERVKVNGENIPENDLLLFFKTYEEELQNTRLSYFEISTALAFWYFSREKVDLAIIETGLGGRLDSTNIINPVLSIITSIGLDHQAILGNSTREIAKEKGGIIKPGIPLLMGKIDEEPREVLVEMANSRNSAVFEAAALSPEWDTGSVIFNEGNRVFQTRMQEPVNAWNVAMAIKATEILESGYPVNEKKVKQAIENFGGIPGRFEKLHPHFKWYFSGAHNIQAIHSMKEALHAKGPEEEAVLVFSMVRDKLSDAVLKEFKPFKKHYFFEMSGNRALKTSELSSFEAVNAINEQNYEEILNELKSELVIFTGSFYFYPIIKRWTNNFG